PPRRYTQRVDLVRLSPSFSAVSGTAGNVVSSTRAGELGEPPPNGFLNVATCQVQGMQRHIRPTVRIANRSRYHWYHHLAGSVPTNRSACSIQPVNCPSPSTPSGSTSTQPFIGLPVMSKSLTWRSSSASS